ncbi:MAG TPA: UbiA-like polyprenyltransferase [Massilibacterium sp.]|nr:UbiA-like polyprenyltransferase [Massilibacterium sp.]
MIKFEHTIFALPFAFLGAILGSLTVNGVWLTLSQWIWITVAMVGARSAAMSLNRVIDAQIDKRNPRTKERAIPAGLLKKAEVYVFIIISFILLFFAAYKLNMLAVKLLPIAVFFLVIYSYTKRFTWACHLVLGIAIGLAPLGGWVATAGSLDLNAFLLFLAVMFWIAGFDVIYASQDAEYDKKEGLYSIPSYFGLEKALTMARMMHVVSFVAFIALFFTNDYLGYIYLTGVLISGVIMIYEHAIVKPNDLSKVDLAFFTMNGTLSVVMFIFSIGDLLI